MKTGKGRFAVRVKTSKFDYQFKFYQDAKTFYDQRLQWDPSHVQLLQLGKKFKILEERASLYEQNFVG